MYHCPYPIYFHVVFILFVIFMKLSQQKKEKKEKEKKRKCKEKWCLILWDMEKCTKTLFFFFFSLIYLNFTTLEVLFVVQGLDGMKFLK